MDRRLKKVLQWAKIVAPDPPAYVSRQAMDGYAQQKMLVIRGGVLHLLSCPKCESERVVRDKKYRLFFCSNCQTHFSVNVGQGYLVCEDYRAGNVDVWPAIIVRDGHKMPWRIGLEEDVPWYWQRVHLFQDRGKVEPDGPHISTFQAHPYHIVQMKNFKKMKKGND